MRFGVNGVWCMVYGVCAWFIVRVQGLVYRVQGVVFRVQDFRRRVFGVRFRV